MVYEQEQFCKTSFIANLLSSNCSQVPLIFYEKQGHNAFMLFIPSKVNNREKETQNQLL